MGGREALPEFLGTPAEALARWLATDEYPPPAILKRVAAYLTEILDPEDRLRLGGSRSSTSP